jgi:hypothetical protein
VGVREVSVGCCIVGGGPAGSPSGSENAWRNDILVSGSKWKAEATALTKESGRVTGLAQRPQRVAADLAHACEKIGFFYALNHGVPDDTIEWAFAASRRFHALPLEQKLALRLDDNNIGLSADRRLDTERLGRAKGNPAESERELFCHP